MPAGSQRVHRHDQRPLKGPPATGEFQAFTIEANGIVDRILTELHVFPAFDPAAPPDPLPKSIKTRALWDTGATKSAISTDLAIALGLAPAGSTKMSHAGGESVSTTYMVNFGLPHGVLVAGILAAAFPAAPDFGAIVGMDVICGGDFSLTNMGGKSTISFRTPSCATVNYVTEANLVRFAGVGRNDPCPCGAGVKFKKCHGK